MTDKYEALKAAALAATPGPWINGSDEDSDYCLVGPHDQGIVSHPVVKLHSEFNAEYIAAASPDVVLALIAERDALAAKIAEMVKYEGELPELPAPDVRNPACGHYFDSWTKGKVEDYARQAIAGALAKVGQCGYDETTGNCTSNPCCRNQFEKVGQSEPVAYMVQFSPGSRWVELTKEEFNSNLNGHIVYKKQAFYAIPPLTQQVGQFCYCNADVSMQMVSGGGAPEGYLGKVTLRIGDQYRDYFTHPQAPAAHVNQVMLEALKKILHTPPALNGSGGFVVDHHSHDGVYLGSENVDPMWVVQEMAGIANAAIAQAEAQQGEAHGN